MSIDFKFGKLRRFQDGDEVQLSEAGDNYKIWKNLRDEFPSPYTIEAAKAWIELCQEDSSLPKFAIIVDGKLCGGVGLHSVLGANHRHSMELGFWLSEASWGKGIMTSAVKALMGYAFNELGLKRVNAVCFAHNAGSRKVLLKAGFKEEGLRRKAVLKEGKYIDEYIFGLLKEDFID